MKKIFLLAVSVSFVSLLISSVFAQQEPAPFTGELNSDNINIRTDSTVSSEIICSIDKGKRVEVVSELYGWYKIRLPKNAPSFIKKNFVGILEDNAAGSSDNSKDINTTQSKTAKLTAERVNIRLKPSESSAVLGKAKKDEVITILEDKGEWYKIEPTDSSFGWINKKFVVKAKPPAEPKPEETNKQTAEVSLPKNSLSIEGIVRPHGIIIKRIASHKLITDDSNIYLLKADKKKLDALNNHRVRVTGKFMTNNKSRYPVIEVDTIETLD